MTTTANKHKKITTQRYWVKKLKLEEVVAKTHPQYTDGQHISDLTSHKVQHEVIWKVWAKQLLYIYLCFLYDDLSLKLLSFLKERETIQ